MTNTKWAIIWGFIALGVMATIATSVEYGGWYAFAVWMVIGMCYQVFDYWRYWEHVVEAYKETPITSPLSALGCALIWPLSVFFDHSGLY